MISTLICILQKTTEKRQFVTSKEQQRTGNAIPELVLIDYSRELPTCSAEGTKQTNFLCLSGGNKMAERGVSKIFFERGRREQEEAGYGREV